MKNSSDSIDRLSVKQITFQSKHGSVKLSVDNDGRLNFKPYNNLETGSFSIDLKNEKIITKKIEFIKDNSFFTSSLDIGSSNSSDVKFDPSTGRLIEDFLPGDFNNIRDNALEAIGKFDPSGPLKDTNLNQNLLDNISKGVTARDKFDADGYLPAVNIHQGVLDDIVKGVTARDKFDADGRLPAVNIHTDVLADITKGVTARDKFDADGRLPAVNIHTDVVADIVKGVTAHGKFDIDGKIPSINIHTDVLADITKGITAHGKFDTDGRLPAVNIHQGVLDNISKGVLANSDLLTADIQITSGGNIRFFAGGTRPVSTGVTIDKTHIGLNNVDNLSSTTIIGNTFSHSTFTTIQTTANTANTLSNTIEGRFTGGRLLENNIEAATVTKITNGNSAHSDLNAADISIDTTGKIQFNRGGSRGSSTGATLTKSHIGLPLAENKSAATIRAEITIDNNGAIQGIGTGIGTVINNNSLGISQASNGTITITRGGTLTSLTANPLSTTTFTTVQSTANTANTLSNTIEGRFTGGKIKSSNLSSDDDGFKFTSSNKLKIGNNNATIATTSGATTSYDSESDFEIITGSTGIPDIAILKARATGSLVIGQINFKGWDGAQSTVTFNGQPNTVNRDRYSPRSTIQASTDASGGGIIDFLTATGAVYNAFMIPAVTPTSPVVRMRIAANGNIGIGTIDPAQDLDINGTMRLRRLVVGTNNGIGRTSAGDITTFSSDRRLKKDINTITGSLNSVCNLRGVTYKWDDTRFNNFIIDDIEKEKIQIGLIAQEVEAVLPELVYNNGIEDLKAVRYAEIVAVLIEAVKELKQKNEQTESSLLQLIIKLSGSNII